MIADSAVILFAGQGAQQVGMGADLIDRYPIAAQRLAQADEVLDFSLSDAMFKGPSSELTRTSRCQPALFVHGMICLEILKDLVPNLNFNGAAGLSLGEFTAHTAAGTFTFEQGLDLVAKRGRFMEEATSATDGTMAAMIGGDEESVRDLATSCNIDVANYNAPGQIVVSGSREGVNQAINEASEYGVRIAKELDVAGAYHSRMMVSAQDKLAPELAALNFSQPTIPVVCNVDADEVSDAEDIRSTLVRQVSGSVRWGDSIKKFLNDGKTNFIEIGPGGVLSGLMKRIDRSASIRAIHDCATIEAAVEFFQNDAVAAA